MKEKKPNIEKQGNKTIVKDTFEVHLNKWGDIHLKKAVKEAFPFLVEEPLLMRMEKDKVLIFRKGGQVET